MKRIVAAMIIVVLGASCKKDHSIDEPVDLPSPRNEVAYEEPSDTLSDVAVKINSLDLASISIVPSASALIFNSVAVGKPDSNGVVRKQPLSNSGWTHPSVVKFKNKWNDYFYWAAITPYPGTDSQYENPHIFCSNDGVSWKEPAGITNPIENAPDGTGYHSDVNLMYENGKMYCYWRTNTVDGRSIWVSTSTDGVHWGKKVKVCQWPGALLDVIAPSFVKDNDMYYCYGVCNYEKTPGNYYNNICIRRMASNDPIEGFVPNRDNGYEVVKIANRPWGIYQEPWHIEVKKVKNLWIMLVTTTNFNGYGSGGRLFLGYSLDGLTFTFNNSPIGNFNGGTYKSSFHATVDAKNNVLRIEMWRAMMSFGWSIFYDKFIIKMEASPTT